MKTIFSKDTSPGELVLIDHEVPAPIKAEDDTTSPTNNEGSVNTPVANSGTLNDSHKITTVVTVEQIKNFLCNRVIFNQFLVFFLSTACFLFVLNTDSLWRLACANQLFVLASMVFLVVASSVLRLLPESYKKLAVLLVVQTCQMICVFVFSASLGVGVIGFSLHAVTLWGSTQTGIWFMLTVLFHYRLCSYKNRAIYGYAAIIPVLVLILAPAYFFVNDARDNLGFVMDLKDYMVNVGIALLLTCILTFISIVHIQNIVKNANIKNTLGQEVKAETV